MKESDKQRVANLCYICKKGTLLTDQEQNYLFKMHHKYPIQYKKIQTENSRKAMAEVNPFRDADYYA